MSEVSGVFRGGRMPGPGGFGRAWLVSVPILTVLAVLGTVLFMTLPMLAAVTANTRVPVVAILAVCVLLSVLPVCICIVQNVTRNRQLKRLESLEAFPVSHTVYCMAAAAAVNKDKTTGVDYNDYFAPLAVYAVVLMLGFFIVSLGICMSDLMAMRSVFLGGWNAATLQDPGLQQY